ncbi:MAG: cyclodeaminase/cyclohydrolase family protein [Planctomycetes bacterium]|nr:cyclodeaminase/cyclohydrolase family protein [Planctomycetota bacterium]
MDELTALPFDKFLDQLADRTPTPGGGAVAAAGGALACAMARMVAAYSLKENTEADARHRIETFAMRLRRADGLLRALVTQDGEAYTKMTAAAKAARKDPAAGNAYTEAVMIAISVPMEIAALASEALATMDEFKALANPYLLSDLGVAAVLAEATAQAARYSVLINARELADETARIRVTTEIAETVSHSAKLREAVESFVAAHLEND